MVMIAALFLPKNFVEKNKKKPATFKELAAPKNDKKIAALLKGRINGYSKKEDSSSTGSISTLLSKNNKTTNRKSTKNI